MENIERKKIYAGLVCRKVGFISCEIVRGIVFEKQDDIAFDLVNGLSYKMVKSRELCVPEGMIVSLDNSLKFFNYKDTLDKEELDRFINKDFSKILKKSLIYNSFPFLDDCQYFSDSELTSLHFGFGISEIEKQDAIHNTKYKKLTK